MANQRKTSSKQNSPSPVGYIIFGIIIGLGIAAAGAYYFRTSQSTPKQTSAPSKPVAPLVAPTAPAVPTPPAVAPVAPPVASSPTPAPQPSNQPAVPSANQQATSPKANKPTPDRIGALINNINNAEAAKSYIPTYLQVGAFKSAEEADAKRAQLLLQGFTNISISKTKVDKTDFFRVRLGPYTSDKALKDAQETLKASSIHATPTR